MNKKTRILRLVALIWQIVVTVTVFLVGILIFTIGKKWFEIIDQNKGILVLTGIHAAIFYVTGIFLFIAAAINFIFVLIDLKVVIKSDKKHTVLGIFEIIFGAIVGGVLIIVAGDGSKRTIIGN